MSYEVNNDSSENNVDFNEDGNPKEPIDLHIEENEINSEQISNFSEDIKPTGILPHNKEEESSIIDLKINSIIKEEEKNSSNETNLLDTLLTTSDNDFSEEAERLGGSSPLVTLILLSLGPFVSQIMGALYGIIDTIWIANAIGDIGMTAISTYSNFDTINRAFGYFLSSGASSMISSLIGSKKGNEAGQLISDLIRVSFIFGIIIPICFVPLTTPIAHWFGASDEVIDLGLKYVLPLLYYSFVTCLYLLACGCLQAEGRYMLYSIIQVVACIINLGILDPIFLYGFKTGIVGVPWATIITEFFAAFYIFYNYYKGKFGIKPQFNDLFKSFSPYSYTALKIGSSQFIFMLSLALPGILMRKIVSLTCKTEKIYNDVMAGYNTLIRLYVVISSVGASIVMGFVPAASYSFGAKLIKRVLSLFYHGSWISISWCLICMIFSVFFSKFTSSIFSHTTSYLEWSSIILKNSTYLAFLIPFPIMIQGLLQSMQYGILATILSSITQLVPLPLFSYILYQFYPNNPGKIFLAYTFQQLFGAIFSLILGYPKFKEIQKLSLEDKFENELNDILP